MIDVDSSTIVHNDSCGVVGCIKFCTNFGQINLADPVDI